MFWQKNYSFEFWIYVPKLDYTIGQESWIIVIKIILYTLLSCPELSILFEMLILVCPDLE